MNILPHFPPPPPPAAPFSLVKKIRGASFNPNHRYLELEQKGPHGNRGVIYQYYVRYTTRKGLLSRLYLLLFNFFFKILQPSSFRFGGRVLPSFPPSLPACARVRVRPRTKPPPCPSAAGAGREGSAGRPAAEAGRYFFPKLQLVSSLSVETLGRAVLCKLLCGSAWGRSRARCRLVRSCREGLCNGGRGTT